MQKNRFGLALAVLLVAAGARAQDCTHLWQHQLSTGPVGPKVYNGDTYASYLVFKFRADPTKRFRLKGEFPRSRFLSIESYWTYKNFPHEALFDYQIEPDAGSDNPFLDGRDITAEPRRYTVHFVPEGVLFSEPNTLTLKSGQRIVSFWLRYYSPHEGVVMTDADIPRVEAFDTRTGKPTSCPRPINEKEITEIPAQLGVLSPKRRQPFEFKVKNVAWAGNAAIPGYSYGFSRMKPTEVMIVKFKAPTFVNTDSGEGVFNSAGDVRYWSLCSSNLIQNIGLACLKDSRAIIDRHGYVTVVHGSDPRIAAVAAEQGINYLPDSRAKEQIMVFLAYRNVLANPEFAEKSRYQGEYSPKGIICSVEEFLDVQCDL